MNRHILVRWQSESMAWLMWYLLDEMKMSRNPLGYTWWKVR